LRVSVGVWYLFVASARALAAEALAAERAEALAHALHEALGLSFAHALHEALAVALHEPVRGLRLLCRQLSYSEDPS